jgi:hypothetical protein
MFCFDGVAKRVVGKPCEIVLRTVSHTTNTPSDISAIVSLKFMFLISLIDESYYTRDKVFHINSIVAAHGRQHQEPSTPTKIQVGSASQDSPLAAMEKLWTTSPMIHAHKNEALLYFSQISY